VATPDEVVKQQYPHVFRPVRVGTMELDHRLVVSPHGGGNGNLMGTDDEFEQHVAMWLAKVRGGMRWIGGGPNFVRNPLPLGFEPTGVGAHGPGFFRHPMYPARIGEFASRVHAEGACLSVQMVLQGGMPIGSSATYSGFNDHRIAHELDADEVRWLVSEYGDSAAIAIDAGVDAIEIHANHDDIVQWFLSPTTNFRDDALRRVVRGTQPAAARDRHRHPGEGAATVHVRVAALHGRADRRRLRRRRVHGG
jgi:2,4-dienoyl-CoA reductase-like NADH-dependent reductase (Old Yellow Enzyme family)